MNKKNLFYIWIGVGMFGVGVLLTYLYFHFCVINNTETPLIEPKIRIGELITWIVWIFLYFGTPFFLKRYVDDEREVKKMILEEINLSIKQSDLIVTKIFDLKGNLVDNSAKKDILINFEILERYLNYTKEQIKESSLSFQESQLDTLYFKYKDAVTAPITASDFIVTDEFYSRLTVDLITLQKFLKQLKIIVMRS